MKIYNKWSQEKTEPPLAGRSVNNILNEETIEKQSGSVQPLIPQRMQF